MVQILLTLLLVIIIALPLVGFVLLLSKRMPSLTVIRTVILKLGLPVLVGSSFLILLLTVVVALLSGAS